MFLIFMAVLDAKRIVVVEDGYFYHYRFLESSLVHKYKPHMYEEIGSLYDSLQKVIEAKVSEDEQRKAFLQGLKREYIFLFFYVLKNELRGAGKDCLSKIRTYVKEAKQNKDLDKVTVEVNGKANRLLYLIWKKPSAFRVMMIRFIIKIFDQL